MQLVRLTTCADGFEARLLAARLGSEGIVWSLRGAHDGPLAIGTVDVLVERGDLAAAIEMLGHDSGFELADVDVEPERETTGADVVLALAILVAVVLFAVAISL